MLNILEIEYPADYIYAKDRLMLASIATSFSKRLTVYLQLNNPSSSDLQQIRGFCSRIGINFHFAKPSLCRQFFKESMPNLEPMGTLLMGKVALMSTDSDPKNWSQVLLKIQENPFVWIIAGQYDGHLLTLEGLLDLTQECASKENFQGQLLSLLQSPAYSLLQTLERPGYHVAALLDQHAKKLASGQVAAP